MARVGTQIRRQLHHGSSRIATPIRGFRNRCKVRWTKDVDGIRVINEQVEVPEIEVPAHVAFAFVKAGNSTLRIPVEIGASAATVLKSIPKPALPSEEGQYAHKTQQRPSCESHYVRH